MTDYSIQLLWPLRNKINNLYQFNVLESDI